MRHGMRRKSRAALKSKSSQASAAWTAKTNRPTPFIHLSLYRQNTKSTSTPVFKSPQERRQSISREAVDPKQ
jgi:hypothetical protein